MVRSMAGFPETHSGKWAYLDINKGDYVTFVHGAWAYNLYIVEEKFIEKDYKKNSPWPPIGTGTRKLYFPYRLCLKRIGEFSEPLVRTDFAFVGESLLARGGYGRSHFQSDQLTLQNVLQMLRSRLYGQVQTQERRPEQLKDCINSSGSERNNFLKLSSENLPEKILQAAIKRKIATGYLGTLLEYFEIKEREEFEILGETAVGGGYIDIFIKEAFPTTIKARNNIIVEVKRDMARKSHLRQLISYVKKTESKGGVLIAKHFPEEILLENSLLQNNIKLIKYNFAGGNLDSTDFDELVERLTLVRLR